MLYFLPPKSLKRFVILQVVDLTGELIVFVAVSVFFLFFVFFRPCFFFYCCCYWWGVHRSILSTCWARLFIRKVSSKLYSKLCSRHKWNDDKYTDWTSSFLAILVMHAVSFWSPLLDNFIFLPVYNLWYFLCWIRKDLLYQVYTFIHLTYVSCFFQFYYFSLMFSIFVNQTYSQSNSILSDAEQNRVMPSRIHRQHLCRGVRRPKLVSCIWH